MKRIVTTALICGALVCRLPCFAQDDAGELDEPLDSGATEEVRVNLVMLETLVLDGQGRTVPDLTRDDFTLTVQGKPVPIDVLDVDCPGGAMDDVRNVEWDKGEVRAPAILPNLERRIIFAFDYYHLATLNRAEAIGQALAMVRNKTAGEEIMIVALANGLRIEQRFTGRLDEVIETLERMEADATLYAMDFGSVTDRSFFDNLATLADVLANYDGPKAVVLFSQLVSRADDWDLWFENVAKHSAAARTVLYPVSVNGLTAGGPTGGSPSLARLATQSGGRFTHGTNDFSLAYARAQRDLACRYAVGFYVDSDTVTDRRAINLRVGRGKYHVFSPEIIRFWSPQERRKAKLDAAFSDPELFEVPLIRSLAFAIRPRSTSTWDGLVVVHLPWPVGPDGADLDVAAELKRGNLSVGKFEREFHLVPPAGGGAGTRSVTLIGETDLKPGSHDLTVVVGKPGGDRFYTSRAEFAVPSVPRDQIFIRGPVLARVVRDGILIRVESKKGKPSASVPARPAVLGEDDTVEPLLVHEFEPSDSILARWEACHVGKDAPTSGGTVRRRVIRTSDGAVAYELQPLPLEMTGRGKVACQGRLDEIPGGTLEPGSYRLEVSAVPAGSDEPAVVARTPMRVN